MRYLAAFSLLLIGIPYGIQAQNKVEDQDLLWVRYNLRLPVGDNWTIVQELEERTYWFPWRQHQFLSRTHLERKFGAGWNAAAGFAFFSHTSPQDPEIRRFETRAELRPHLESGYMQDLHPKWAISHRYRTDFRFFEQDNGGFGFKNIRMRYKLELQFKPAEAVTLKAFDEIHLNLGNKITYNVFDQNRYGASVQYMPWLNFGLECGYLRWFQQQASGNEFFRRNIIRITIHHIIPLQDTKK